MKWTRALIPSTNLFDQLPAQLPVELIETLASAHNLRIERILSKGHASPPDFWYDQSQHESVLLLQGAARLQFDSGVVDLKPGDFITISAHQRHRVDWTDPDVVTIWLAIFYEDSCA
ncbi:MAG: cupin domain-containing protein [Planctomycetota bacterium]